MSVPKVPIYFSMGLTEKANNYYKMFITWTNEKIRKTFVERNMFDFKHIKGFDRSYINNPGPMVIRRFEILEVSSFTFCQIEFVRRSFSPPRECFTQG